MSLIIKSHIRAGYRAAADYLKSQGKNEAIRLVEIGDPDAKNLDEAFQNMWKVACETYVKKPLHHISINPSRDERRLTDAEVLKIVERCEEKYGYKPGDHQRVIVEHVLDGRRHYHVIWNRVSLTTGKTVWPGQHWNKSKQAAREMEKELGLKPIMSRRMKRARRFASPRIARSSAYYNRLKRMGAVAGSFATPRVGGGSAASRVRDGNVNRALLYRMFPAWGKFVPASRSFMKRGRRRNQNIPDSEKMPFHRPEWDTAELIAWALQNQRWDILAQFGFFTAPDDMEL